MDGLSKNRVKELAKLHLKKYRELTGKVVIEGIRLIEQIAKYGIEFEEVYVTEENLLPNLKIEAKKKYLIKYNQLKKITSTKNPQPIAALVDQKYRKLTDKKLILYLDGVKDPGNLGTIIRTAAAIDVSGIVLSPDCCELYNPKVVRASLGSVFYIPLEIHKSNWLRSQNAKIFITAINDAEDISEIKNITGNIMLVIGSEAFGVSDEILTLADQRVRIPISKNIESLNVAVATGIALFQIKLSLK